MHPLNSLPAPKLFHSHPQSMEHTLWACSPGVYMPVSCLWPGRATACSPCSRSL
ncbi:hypothetical protein B0H19DRAFT_1104742 [Mycena capillaripes]|nr:hypothetical protein B0H19DRAFT_1104742 [Mycena capillaripes]